MQVAAKNMPAGALIIGVDIMPIKPIRGTICLEADITTDKCRQMLKKEMKHLKAGVILNDGAPNVGGGWHNDAFTQSGLVLMSLKLAVEWLAPGGWFVSKVFRSRDYNSLMYVLNKLFTKVHATKPQSSRNVSAEIFVVCQGFLAPDSIDPRMLDPKFVFAEVEFEGRTTDIFKPEVKRRQRNGYEEGNFGQHKTYPVEGYINSSDFLEVLGKYNALTFTEGSSHATHPKTSAEIRALCSDLKLLGKKDFRVLIKWRKELLKTAEAEAAAIEAANPATASDGEEEEDGDDDEDDSDAELAALEDAASEAAERKFREKKRERRKRDKARVKTRERQALNMDQPQDVDDLVEDSQLFAMKQIESKEGLAAVDGADMEVEEEDQAGVLIEAGAKPEGHEDEGVDSDTLMEKELDTAYDAYLERKGMLTKKVAFRNKTKTLGMAGPSAEDAPDNDYVPDELSSDSEDDGNPKAAGEHNPLVVQQRGAAAAKDKVTAQWFAQSQFAGMADSDSDDDFGLGGGAAAAVGGGADVAAADAKLEVEAAARGKGKSGFSLGSDSDSDSEDGDAGPGFEEVAAAAHAPKPKDMSKNLDAHGLALAAEMILRKRKREIVDNAYSRYTFNDPVKPAWFEDEEMPHMVTEVPLTKEMARDIKEREREINARPIKKVLEAKGRLKRRTAKEKAKTTQKATSINESTTLSEGEKAAQIREVFSKARRAAKKGEDGKPTIVLARKGGGGKGVARPNGVTGKFKVVDKRYRSDLNGKKKLDKRKKGGKRDKYKGRK
eukprot:gene22218-5646_t